MTRPNDERTQQGTLSITSKDPKNLDEIRTWIHDQDYEPDEIRYDADEHILEIPFLCRIYGESRDHRGFAPLYASWWIPAVGACLRVHHVQNYTLREDGPGQFSEMLVARGGLDIRLTGLSEISISVDQFEVSVELSDRIIGWVRMRWILLFEMEGPLVEYDQQADDLGGREP
jgi:hypothetical protein